MASLSTPAAILPAATARSREIRAALAAGLLGLSLIFVAGFVGIPAVHDAAHDGRHSLAFPCH
jgi:cobalt transporter subunit CbtB